MLKEVFRKYRNLTLFNCPVAAVESDGRFPMHSHRGTVFLNLKDTAVNPENWENTELDIEFSGFEENSNLILCFGKPYENEKAETAKLTVEFNKDIFFVRMGEKILKEKWSEESGIISLKIEKNRFNVCGKSFELESDVLKGYAEILSTDGENLALTGISIETEILPYTEEEHLAALLEWRKKQLDKNDEYLNRLEEYIKENPCEIKKTKGELVLPLRIADKGETVILRAVCHGSKNAAMAVTHNSFAAGAMPVQIPLSWKKDGENYYADVELKLDVPGNTRIEFWVNRDKITRQIAVLDKGYTAVIPWIGDNKPYLDEELHRFDIPGDYWMPEPEICADPKETVEKFRNYVENYYKYGDRTACLVNGRAFIPLSETGSLFELDEETQKRGFSQLKRQMRILGYDDMELIASYTPDKVSADIMEKSGVKGITSLCAWQNWQDGGWKINHCGVSNQPYYPADDDFRRSGKKRKIMCFTMGNSSCDRNYSIMAYDACPTNAVPGERYLENFVVNQNIQRFYDFFDGFISDGKNSEDLLTVTVALESFTGRMDWTAANSAAIRYMAKKAAEEKLVFVSAADISDYHRRKNLDMQEAYFFQPDCYYGFHNGTMPGRIGDRIEADTKNYLAVIRKGSLLPMYFYDYGEPWESAAFEDTERNEFGLIDPDTHKPSECMPKQVYTEDVEMDYELSDDKIIISINSESSKKRMVTGIFDVPFENDFELSADKNDVSCKKVTDSWTGNTHLFIDLGKIEKGKSKIVICISGKPRKCESAEYIKDLFGAMFFGNHAYLRSLDKEYGIEVEIKAPPGAYLLFESGEKIYPKNGILKFKVNEAWQNESPTLYGYDKAEFEKNISCAKVKKLGETTCSRWSGQ